MNVSIKIGLLGIFLSVQAVCNSYANDQAQVCAACHGVNGVSSDKTVPNLASQQQAYLVSQLKAFKSNKRSNAIMNAIAANLTDNEIDALATFFNQQDLANPQVDSSAKEGSVGTTLKSNQLTFPENFPSDYSQYTTVNRADNKQVRYLYLDNASMQAFKDTGVLPNDSSLVMVIYKAKVNDQGELLEGRDGYYQKDTLAAYAVMKKELGWGDKLPKEIRNDNWKYGFFKSDKEHHPTRNMAKCMACHKPLADQEFMFSFERLKAK